jgi:hypothetical protein
MGLVTRQAYPSGLGSQYGLSMNKYLPVTLPETADEIEEYFQFSESDVSWQAKSNHPFNDRFQMRSSFKSGFRASVSQHIMGFLFWAPKRVTNLMFF